MRAIGNMQYFFSYAVQLNARIAASILKPRKALGSNNVLSKSIYGPKDKQNEIKIAIMETKRLKALFLRVFFI